MTSDSLCLSPTLQRRTFRPRRLTAWQLPACSHLEPDYREAPIRVEIDAHLKLAAGASPCAREDSQGGSQVTHSLLTMSLETCPKCQQQGRLLGVSSEEARVNYYRCNDCRHVWTHQKNNPDSQPVDVTLRLTPDLIPRAMKA